MAATDRRKPCRDRVAQKRRLLAALAALIVAATLMAAVLMPPLFDWNRYRDTIASVAGHRLGRSL